MASISELIQKFRDKKLTTIYSDIDTGVSRTNSVKIKNDINKLIDVMNSTRPAVNDGVSNSGTTCPSHIVTKIDSENNISFSVLENKINSMPSLTCNNHQDLTCGCVSHTWSSCSCNSVCTCFEKRSCISGKNSSTYGNRYVNNSCTCNSRCACNTERAFR